MKYLVFLLFQSPVFASTDWNQLISATAGESQQAIVVTAVKGVQAEIRLFEKTEKGWSLVSQSEAVVGMSGFAEAGAKIEGDKKTPTGTYGFDKAFGYGPQPATQMTYVQVDDEDKFVDDVNSPEYNQWVHGPTQAKSFEKMKRKDGIYELGLVINYNTHPVEKGKGSAIFLHIWRSAQKGTAGCVAVSKEYIVKILKWLAFQHIGILSLEFHVDKLSRPLL